MLASITPLGERGRQQRWAVTVAAHLLGSLAGGAAIGALLGGAAASLGGSARAAAALLGSVLIVGVALDLGIAGLRLPTHRRQVDQRWLGRYRGWVYGAGFGAQLGTGVATIATSSTVYATLVGCLLAPTAAWSCAIGAAFGATRGAVPLLTAGINEPTQLVAFHARLVRLAAPASRATLVLQSLLGVAAVTATAWHA